MNTKYLLVDFPVDGILKPAIAFWFRSMTLFYRSIPSRRGR